MRRKSRPLAPWIVVALAALTGCADPFGGLIGDVAGEAFGVGGKDAKDEGTIIPASAETAATLDVVEWRVFEVGKVFRYFGLDAQSMPIVEIEHKPIEGQTAEELTVLAPIEARIVSRPEGHQIVAFDHDEQLAELVISNFVRDLQAFDASGGDSRQCTTQGIATGVKCAMTAIGCAAPWTLIGGIACVAGGGLCLYGIADTVGECRE